MARITDIVSQEAPDGQALQQLRQMFLAHATSGQVYLDDPATLAAYRSYFFLQTFEKALSVLREVQARPAVVWDLGAAMGPAAFAAAELWPQAEVHAFDFSARALQDAQRLATAAGVQLQTHVHDLRKGLPAGKPDLVIVANALSELPFPDREAICRSLLQHTLVIIEPADREHARALQQLRDALLPTAPVAPCPHTAGCPALQRERDFCHQVRAVTWPEWHRRLQQQVGLSDERLRFSYLLYAPEQTRPSGVRIISNPLPDKGRLRFFGCAESGLVELIRQNKHKSDDNAAFNRLDRGSLVALPRTDRVTKIGPADCVQELGGFHRSGL